MHAVARIGTMTMRSMSASLASAARLTSSETRWICGWAWPANSIAAAMTANLDEKFMVRYSRDTAWREGRQADKSELAQPPSMI